MSWVRHPYYRAGDKSCIFIPYFVKRCTDYNSFVDYNTIGNKGTSLTNVYIFLEELGVLTLDGENYLPEAIIALKRVKKAMDGEICVWSHNPVQVKERWELAKIGFRIFDFLPADKSFGEAVQDYIDLIEIDDKIEDYTILSGVSRVQGNRVVQTNLKTGLKLKKK